MSDIINTTQELKAFCDALKEEKFITVDTEFIRETTYYPRLCLIQIAGEEVCAAIDPLAEGIDLSPVFELMKNENILKVFHACRQDLEIFYQLMNSLPVPLFDTQVAAMVCGFAESISYENLVYKITGEAVDKSSRFTDWSQRPLTAKQVDYALDDVIHLRDIYEYLSHYLEEKQRKDWIQDEMQGLSDVGIYQFKPQEAWRRIRLRSSSSPKYLAVLQAVAAWREECARKRNQPRGRIMKDDTLAEVASVKPKDLASLQKIRGIISNIPAKEYQLLLDKIAEVEKLSPKDYPALPSKPEHAGNNESLVGLLRLLLKEVANQQGVVSRLLADKDDIDLLAAGKYKESKLAEGWRYELFGEQALRLMEGKIAVKSNGQQGVVFIEV